MHLNPVQLCSLLEKSKFTVLGVNVSSGFWQIEARTVRPKSPHRPHLYCLQDYVGEVGEDGDFRLLKV